MAVTRIPIPAWAKTQKTDNRMELSLSEIDLVVRTVNCLEDHGIFTVADLLNSTPKQLLEIPNLGEKTLETIYAPWRRSASSALAASPPSRCRSSCRARILPCLRWRWSRNNTNARQKS